MTFTQSPIDIIFRFREAGMTRIEALYLCRKAARVSHLPKAAEVYQQAADLLEDNTLTEK
jgi:hypothetical protein